MALINPAKERLKNNELALGVGIRLVSSVAIAKVMKSAGFDWIFLDLEHGTLSIETTAQISIAALDAGIAPLVRVPAGDLSLAMRALLGGALGIVMPHVDSAQEAQAIVDALRYPPLGHLGIGPVGAHFDFKSIGVGQVIREINDAALLVAMLETPAAIEQAEAIAAVPGLDALLIGTNDLCMELGIPGEHAHPQITQAYERVIAACRRHGKWAGLGGINSDELLTKFVGMGVRLVLAGADLNFMMAAAAKRADFLRKLKPAA